MSGKSNHASTNQSARLHCYVCGHDDSWLISELATATNYLAIGDGVLENEPANTDDQEEASCAAAPSNSSPSPGEQEHPPASSSTLTTSPNTPAKTSSANQHAQGRDWYWSAGQPLTGQALPQGRETPAITYPFPQASASQIQSGVPYAPRTSSDSNIISRPASDKGRRRKLVVRVLYAGPIRAMVHDGRQATLIPVANIDNALTGLAADQNALEQQRIAYREQSGCRWGPQRRRK